MLPVINDLSDLPINEGSLKTISSNNTSSPGTATVKRTYSSGARGSRKMINSVQNSHRNSVVNGRARSSRGNIRRQPSVGLKAMATTRLQGFSTLSSRKVTRNRTIRPLSSTLRNLDQIVKERIPIKNDESDSLLNAKLHKIDKNPDIIKYQHAMFKDKYFSPIMALPDYRKMLHKQKRSGTIVWLRPHQISNNPQFSTPNSPDSYADSLKTPEQGKNMSPDDIIQGEFDNCWFLATLSVISIHHEILHRVAPPQTFNFKNGYRGKFNFKFYYYGEWIEVTIDDRLPVIIYPDGQFRLLGCSSTDKNEFWSALVEKAYAKLNGGYHVLTGGNSNQAMIDMTGGAVEERKIAHEIAKRNDDDFQIMFRQISKYIDRRVLLNCSIQGDPSIPLESKRPDNLYYGHAYSVTGIMTIPLNQIISSSASSSRPDEAENNEIQAIRIRNPWGTAEWTGLKNNLSPEVYEEWLEAIINDEDDDTEEGEFWMPFANFIEIFTNINICRLNMYHYRAEGSWHEVSLSGRWSVEDDTAGGLKKLTENPYIPVELLGGETSDQLIVILQHRFTRQMKINTITGQGPGTGAVSSQIADNTIVTYNPIGFVLYKINKSKLDIRTLREEMVPLNKVITSKKDKNGNRGKIFGELTVLRDYCKTIKKLDKGRYAVIPISIKSPVDKTGEEGEFFMKVYVEK